jgi:hypothetical protein
MRRVGLPLLLSILLVSTAADGPRSNRTDALDMGLEGPVHTVKSTTQWLPTYGRIGPLAPYVTHEAWIAFGPDSDIIERSNRLSPDGTPEAIVREKKNSHGQILERKVIRADQTTTWRYEYVNGPYGPVETRTYEGDVLQSVVKNTYDEDGHMIEESTHDPAGRLKDRFISHYDDLGREVELEVWGPDDQFQLHEINTYGSHGDFVGKGFLDMDGRIILSMAFRDQQLLSVRRGPECRVLSTCFTISGKDQSTVYRVWGDCRVHMTVQRHPGREENIENDELETFNEAGESLEKLTFQYERDSYGNWTRRIVSVFDPSTNSLVPIQEDARTITYYP